MSGFSGKTGSVKESGGAHVAEVIAWDHDPRCAVPKWASNSTSGVKTGVEGTHDSSGKIEVKVDNTHRHVFRVGGTYVLELHVDATGNNYIVVTAIIENKPISVKIDPDGEPVSATFNYQGITRTIHHGFLAGPGSSSGF
jgi:hypothetical protein